MFSRFLVSWGNQQKLTTAGFSLVELLVSIGIVVLVMAIVITRQDGFNGAVLLRSQAYEIALAVREAQLSAVSAQSDGNGNFRSVIGVYFNTDVSDRYVLFIDANNNNFYDNGEAFGAYGLLDPRFEIKDIRPSTGVLGAGNDMSVIYERPNFDAHFFDAPSSERAINSIAVDIGFSGGTGSVCGVDIRTIEITQTGLIYVVECS